MVNTEKIIIIGDRVLVRPSDTMNKTSGGLYLPPSVTEKEKVQDGYVIKTGPGYAVSMSGEDDEPWKEKSNAKYIPLQAKAGDFALFLRKDCIEVEIEKEKFFVIPHSAILLLFREEDL